MLERGNKSWKIQMGERVDVVSRDRLKPHLGSVAPKAALPPKRGRPRTASVVWFLWLQLLWQRSQGLCSSRDYIAPGDDCTVNPPRICM